MSKFYAYSASRIFTGIDKLNNHSIVVKNGIIDAILPTISLPDEMEKADLGNVTITPPLMDLQLYGAFGRLLSVYPDAFTVSEIVRYCQEGGAAYCMPTVATNTYEVIFQCIDAIKQYWSQDGKGVLGLHVEGPWISVEKRGAHNPEWIFSPSLEQARELLEYGKDVIKMITLAPEVCSEEVIDLIHSYNIIISAGHSNATYHQATDSFNSKIETVTHLFNAMSPLHHREPGLAGATLDHATVRASIIPDGHHVHYAAIGIAKKIMGERLFIITDAVTTTTEGYYTHRLDGNKYASNGILSGSALTMHQAMLNLIREVDIPLEEAIRMCSLYPARLINKSDELALLKKGYPAHMMLLDEKMNLVKMIL